MTPITKAHSLTFAIVTPVVFLIWKSISSIYGLNWILDMLITAIISAKFYELVYKMLLQVYQKLHILKKWLLGQRYFAGLWMGYYSLDGIRTFYYEFFEQSLESLSIKGTAFDENFNQIGSWTIMQPYINIEESKLAYYYEMDELALPDVTLGFAKATIHWDKSGMATKLTGFAVGSFSMKKEPFVSIKVNIPNKPALQQKWLDTKFHESVQELSQHQF